jgi:hypothetical protein
MAGIAEWGGEIMKGKGKAKGKHKPIEVGDLVFLPTIGLCRVVKLYPDAKDDEFNMDVKDSRGVMWATDVELVVREDPTPVWFSKQRARVLAAVARGRRRYRDCIRN